MRHPVITGVGIVAAPGSNVDEVWQAISTHNVGLKPMSLFPSPRYGPVLTGEIQRDLSALGAPRRGSRSDRLGWIAAREAVRSAGIDFQSGGERAGVTLGCSVGGSFDSESFLIRLIQRGVMRPRSVRFHECVSAVEMIADEFGLFGPSMAVATACSSSAVAIATAAEMIQAGEADVMLAGGTDSLSRMTWGGFHSLLLVDSQGCRPFDTARAGMSLGEGAAVLVLEAEETAQRRGATILARLTGWGASCDAYHVTAPDPEGAGALAAMRSALRRAELEPSAIDYVNAHGTGTRDNDLAESKALKTLFGDHVPPFSSTKRFFGHALAASGAIEAAICVEALRRQQLPPNPGFSQADPAIGLEPVTALRSAPLTHVMSNSFGFGGNNAVLIFSTPETKPKTRAARPGPATVAAVSTIGPGVYGQHTIEPPLPPDELWVYDCGKLNLETLTSNQRRRLSRMNQMAILAARGVPRPDPSARVAVAIGTGYGCLEEGAQFIENLIAKNESEPMPAKFPGSVHNAPAGHIAIDLGARGLNSAPTAGGISFECALWQAMRQLDAGEADVALAGAIDELNKYPLSVGRRWGFWNEKLHPGEGAVVVRLAPTGTEPRLARVTAIRLGRYGRPFDVKREVDWIASAVDLNTIKVFSSGAGGWPTLEDHYQAVAAELSARAGRAIEHEPYKEHCGEFHSASGFGFAFAVEIVRHRQCGVLLYTLSPRGGKALCCIQP